MPLPDDFSPYEHLLQTLIGLHNRVIEQSFIGVVPTDLEDANSSLKLACLLTDDDTIDMIVLRLNLYYWVVQANLPTPVFGIPTLDHQSGGTYKPQIILHFQEQWTADHLENNLTPVRSRISFRLMQKTSQTITPQDAQTLATKIKELFGSANGYSYQTGVVKASYRDLIHGYQFIISVTGESEAIAIIERVLEIQGHAFDEQFLTISQSKKNFPVIPPMQEIYGKERRPPRRRPLSTVHFRRAELHVWGLADPTVLIDKSGRGKPLVH